MTSRFDLGRDLFDLDCRLRIAVVHMWPGTDQRCTVCERLLPTGRFMPVLALYAEHDGGGSGAPLAEVCDVCAHAWSEVS
jgi:hypothetical protein